MNQKTAKNENKKRFICGGYLTHKAQPHTFARNRYYASHAPLVDIEIIQKKKKKTSGEEVKKIEQSFRFSPINADTHTQNTHTNHRTQHTHIQRYSNIGYLWLWCINVHSNIYTPMLMEATTGASNSFHIIILIVNLFLFPPANSCISMRPRAWLSVRCPCTRCVYVCEPRVFVFTSTSFSLMDTQLHQRSTSDVCRANRTAHTTSDFLFSWCWKTSVSIMIILSMLSVSFSSNFASCQYSHILKAIDTLSLSLSLCHGLIWILQLFYILPAYTTAVTHAQQSTWLAGFSGRT